MGEIVTETNKDKICKTRLLSDLPSDKDSFGSHERVAEAIADLIRTENGGKAIALIGTWGSGKSTVVKLLENLLRKSNNHPQDIEIFTYDAWTHQGDPLRRSFLEEIIDFLFENGRKWVNKDYWKKQKDKLSRRLKITETTQRPQLTKYGKYIAGSVFLVPIGITIFSASFKLDEKIFPFPSSLILNLIGIFVSLLPLIVTAIAYFRTEKNKRDDVIALLVNKSETHTKNETIETPEPTSVEFQNYFFELACEALKDNNRRLLVVIDNLDRVTHEEALSLWSTMRTFFDHNNKRCKDWIDKFWLLIPFDKGGLSSLWNNTENRTPTSLGEEFLKKTFQAFFEVPPPVLIDWKDFLYKCLKNAFPNHNENDFHSIYRLYKLERVKTGNPTPRDIKLFVNNIGTYHRIWEDKIPLHLQALYVLKRDKIAKPEEDLRKPDFIDEAIKGLIGEDYLKHLASLYFNVRQDKALYVLMGEQVEDSLIRGDIQKIRELKFIGLAEVCEHIVENRIKEWIEKEPKAIALTARAISTVEESENESWVKIWDSIINSIESINDFGLRNEAIGEGLVNIQKHLSSNMYEKSTRHILKALSTIPTMETISSDEKAQEWIKGILIVLIGIIETGKSDLIYEEFKLQGTAEIYLTAISKLIQESTYVKYTNYFNPLQPADIINKLVEYCSKDALEPFASTTHALMTNFPTWPWQNLTSVLDAQVKNASTTPINVKIYLHILLKLLRIDNSSATDILKDITSKGFILHHLHAAYSANDFSASALCLLPIIVHLPNGNVVKHVGNSSLGLNLYNDILISPQNYSNIISELANYIGVFEISEKLINNLKDKKTFLQAVLDIIVKSDNVHNIITPEIVIGYFKDIKDIIPEKYKDVVIRITENANLPNLLAKQDFYSDLSEVYLICLNVITGSTQESFVKYLVTKICALDLEKWLVDINNIDFVNLTNKLIEIGQNEYINYIRKNMQLLSKDIWQKALTENSNLIAIIELLNNNLNLTAEFSDALFEEIIKQLNNGKPIWETSMAEKLINALSSPLRFTFLRDLRDHLIKYEKSITPALILFGKPLINVFDESKEKADDAFRHLFKHILERKESIEFDWLNDVISSSKVAEQCKPESFESFKARLIDILKEDALDENIKEKAERIAKELEINIEKIYSIKAEEKEKEVTEVEEKK